jgi:carbonic anhydrase/acetyltransferase-like protein (isoleucine patch superfamily)
VVASSGWVAPTAVLIGDVHVGPGASIWYGVVIRADREQITIAAGSNVQDNAVLHADPGSPCRVGSGVTIGHAAVVHGCTIDDGALVGMHATVLNGAVVGAGAMVAAGAVVTGGSQVPPGTLAAGVPAGVRRSLTSTERTALRGSAATYEGLRELHRAATAPPRRAEPTA